MGDSIKSPLGFATHGYSSLFGMGMGGAKDAFEDVSGVSAAKDAAKESKKGIQKQKQLEDAKLAEKDDEIARRRLRSGSRGSLIATSPRGVQSLGG